MVVAPFYEALTLDETLRYLRTVAAAVDIPVMLYNLPPATGVNLEPDTVGALAREIENIQYVKDTSADMVQACKLIHYHGDVVSTFVGWDSLMLAALVEGAAGVMSGVSNAIPHEMVAVHRALVADDLAMARSAWSRIYPLVDSLTSAPFVQAVKVATNARGLAVGDPREPMATLDSETADRIRKLAESLGASATV
jgi:4-hydroxy-tetrahydrodipicolinate synthase